MKVLENLNDKSFLLDGVPYTKVYQLKKDLSEEVSLVNIYDSSDVLFREVNYNNIQIGENIFESVNDLLLAFEDLKANFNLGEAAPSPSNIYNQNNITFTNNVGDYFGSVEAPRTGVLTFETTAAVRGGIAIIYYDNATLQMPSVWRTRGNFVPNEVNKIYLERDGEGFVTCNIVSTSSDSTPTATAPTITVTDI